MVGTGVRSWRKALKVLFGVAVLVVVSRWWVLQILLVPSPSMEPLLHGDPEGGDQLVVFKPYYRFADPQRFDLVVFRPPDLAGGGVEIGRYMVKRVAALGGERVSIRGGDLYIARSPGEPQQILIKDYSQFDRVLIPVWDEAFDGDVEARWRLSPDLAERTERGLELHGGSDAKRSIGAFSRLPVTNAVLDVAGKETPGEQFVSDVVLRVELTLEDPEAGLVVRLNEQQDLFWFLIGAEAEVGNLRIEHVTTDHRVYPARASLTGLRAGRRHVVEVWNVDDNLGIAIDGKEQLTFQHPAGQDSLGQVQLVAALGAYGGRAIVHEVSLRRDIHYTDSGSDSFTGSEGILVPEDSIFVLGDLSQESIDSRHYGPVPQASLVGKPMAVFLPLSRARWIP
jgi:signal peptidase I